MAMFNVHAARTHFSALLARAAAGEEIVIARAGAPVAKLVPLGGRATAKRKLGRLSRRAAIPDDFDAPLPEAVLETLERS